MVSRTDKTKPFWVKLMHGDLDWAEFHDHRDGVCDMPPIDDAVAFTFGTTQCHRVFEYTGRHVCCCHWCHSGDDYTLRPGKRERLDGKKACREWSRDY